MGILSAGFPAKEMQAQRFIFHVSYMNAFFRFDKR